MPSSPSPAAQRQLDALRATQPESEPLLRLLAEALGAAADPSWEAIAAAVALRSDGAGDRPLLAGAAVPLDRTFGEGWLRHLLRLAALGGLPGRDGLDGLALLAAAVAGDDRAIAEAAVPLDLDPEALATIAGIAAMPLLQACRRRFGAVVPPGWSVGYCPLCGAWAALAERRGLERERRLRCGRCGADWRLAAMRCAFCGETDHRRLGTLVPEGGGEAQQVETCDRCRGYLKSIATLRAWAPDEVCLADLASIDLDLAALERDYRRPGAPPPDLGVRVVAREGGA